MSKRKKFSKILGIALVFVTIAAILGGFLATSFPFASFGNQSQALAQDGPELEWDKTFGGVGHDAGCSVQQTSDGGYIIAGETDSYGAGGYAVWLIKAGAGPTVTWNCPLGGQPLIAPNPGKGRPDLGVPADCAGITVSAGAALWGIYYLVETGPDAGTWLCYIPGFVTSPLTQLEPGEYYWVVVSAPCALTILQ
jgi:hypothetical protein